MSDPWELGITVRWGWIQIGPDRSIGYECSANKDEIVIALHSSAVAELPPGTRYELRECYPMNFGRTHEMAWYSNGLMADAPEWKNVPPHRSDELGCIIYGRYVTPGGKS